MHTSIKSKLSQFKDKKVLIFGLGLLGGAVGDARFFVKCGAKVRVTDQKTAEQLKSSCNQLRDLPIEYSLGGHHEADIIWADIIVRNPSIPQSHPLLQNANILHKRIVMRTSLFVELASIKTIGITGTRGKTTTTMMVYELAKLLPSTQILLGGNIAGQSDLELLETIKDPGRTIAILELSSWQLQGFNSSGISPEIAVITNLFPDHLNIYPDLLSYYRDKKIILEHQKSSDFIVLNHEQLEFHHWVSQAKGKVIWFSKNIIPQDLQLRIPGEHNRANAAAALKVAEILGIGNNQAISTLNQFEGVRYRQEVIRSILGVTFINDTTSTTPTALLSALNTRINSYVLICGGSDKNLPIDCLFPAINERPTKIVLLPGNGTDRIRPLLDKTPYLAQSMLDAVGYAYNFAKQHHVAEVILSPGFTSFGLFNNEFDRGEQFDQCVNELK